MAPVRPVLRRTERVPPASTHAACDTSSIGHLCYFLHDGDRRDRFTGDTLLFGRRIILQDTWDCDLRTHLGSLRRLDGRGIAGLFPGHRTVSTGDGQRHVAAALEAVDRGRSPATL
jgi:hypothetical protein